MTQVNTVRTFESNLFGSLYTFTADNGGIWFVGKQVAEALGYVVNHTNSLTNTLNRHCTDKVQVGVFLETLTETVSVLPQGVRRNSVLISEADLYRLVMNSQLEGAVQFQDWVVREVLPSIREHGGYHVEQPTMAEQRQDPELFRQVNETMASLGDSMRQMAENQTQLMGMVVDLVRIVSNRPAETPLRTIQEGHMTRRELFELTGGRISESAFKSLLRHVRWPSGTYERSLDDGRVVELTSFPAIATVMGQSVHINQILDRVITEARAGINSGRQISSYYFEHSFITGRFRIND